MPEMSDYDVAIVGASLGGCTAATFLGRQGAKVALIESHSDPAAFKRMCTHFIQASASPTIDRLGIGEALREARARQTDTNVRTRYGWISVGREAAETKLKPHNRFGYMASYRDTPLVTGDSAQMWLLDPDVAYAFPTDDDLVCLAVFPSKDKLANFKADPEQGLARVFENLPDGPRLDPAKRVGNVLGKLDMPNVIRKPVQPGLALVGDAALAADPLWGVGCGWALQSAEWLAESVGPALSGGPHEVDAGLERYRTRHRAGLAAHEKFTSEYSTARRFNPMEKMLFRGAARDEVLAQRMALMGERWIPPQKMLTPGLIARMIRVNVSRGRRPLGLRRAAPSVAA